MSKCCKMRRVVNDFFIWRVMDNFFHIIWRTLVLFWEIMLTSIERGGMEKKGLSVVEGFWSCSWGWCSSCVYK